MRRRWSILVKLFVMGLFLSNVVQTVFQLYFSHYNYPGAEALMKLHALRKRRTIFCSNCIKSQRILFR